MNLTPFAKFIVAAGGTMAPGDTTFTHPDLAGKDVIVFADGIKIPEPPVAMPAKRTVEKVTADPDITFNGGVADTEIIEIFIY